MALVNPNIAMSFRQPEFRPRNALAEYAQLQSIMGGQRQAELADYQLEAAKRAERSTAIQNELYARHFDPETGSINAGAFAAEAAKRGQGGILPGFFKTEAERQTAAQALRKSKVETEAAELGLQQKKFRQAWENAGAADTPQLAIDQLTKAVRDGEIDMASASREINQLQNMQPDQYRQWRISKIAQFLDAKDRVAMMQPKIARQESGGEIVSFQDNPALPGYGLPAAGIPRIAKTATIGEITAQGQLGVSQQRLEFERQKFAWEQANPGNTIQQLEDGTIVAINNRTGVARPVTMGAPSAPVSVPAAAAQGTNALAPGAADANALAPGAPAVRGSTVAAQRLAFDQQNAAQRMAFEREKFAWEQANPGKTIQQLDDGRIVAINNRTGVATPVTLGELGAPAKGSTVAAQTLEFQKQKFAWEQANPGRTIQQLDDGRIVAINNRTGVATPVTMGEFGAPARGSTVAERRLAFDREKLAWERANPGFELRENADGTVYGVNKRTLQAVPVTIGGAAPSAVAPGAAAPGSPANAARSAGAPTVVPSVAPAAVVAPGTPLKGKGSSLTETQSNAVAFGMRMADADATIKQLESSGVTSGGRIRGFVEGALTSLVPFQGEQLAQGAGAVVNTLPGVLGGPSAEQQQYAQAKLNFVTAVLRKESGAAISPSEFANEDKKYFPQAGDSDRVVQQKRRARELAIQAMKVQAGPGGKDIGVAREGGANDPNDPLGLRTK